MGRSLCFDADGQLTKKPFKTQVAVFKGFQERPAYYVKPKAAFELVKNKLATFIDKSSIRLIAVKPVAKSAYQVAGSNKQGKVYTSAAADPNRRYFQGGLQRTEHNPVKFDGWSGAKVGHQ